MGSADNVGLGTWPKQGGRLNAQVKVAFGYDFAGAIPGRVVRDDVEAPYRMIILLNDGRFVLSDECQYAEL